MKKRLISVLTALMVVPSILPAQGRLFEVPEGCTAVMTVQSRSCSVANYWTCEADATGDMWRAESGPQGPYYVSKTDFEAQWVESYGLYSGTVQTLQSPSDDPASFSELVETGLDAYDFIVVDQDGVEERVVGFDRLTGEETEIDGEPLLLTEFAARITTDGELVYATTGQQFLSVRHRVFFSGLDETTSPDSEPRRTDRTPVSFAYPGERGFLASTPTFGCDATDISLRP